jgi:hypothetical protein
MYSRRSVLRILGEARVILSLMSNFRRILNVVCFLLGNSPAYEFYILTFRNTLFHIHQQGPPPPCHPPSDWLRLFSSQNFSRINTPTFLKPSHFSHLPACEYGTECSETSAYKIHTSGNYPEESIQQFFSSSKCRDWL